MALVALIAAAGFIVVAQRRQRQLKLLGAIGATERQLRLAMVANGAIVGVLSAVVGSVLGLAGWVLAAPVVETAADHRINRFDIPAWGLVAGCMIRGCQVASTAAAWWPARTIARQPVMRSLSRRPARPTAVHRSLAAAAVLVAAGVAAISLSHPTGDHVRPIVLIVGVVAVVLGVVFVAPAAAIRVLAAPAGRLPFAPRLALRDLVPLPGTDCRGGVGRRDARARSRRRRRRDRRGEPARAGRGQPLRPPDAHQHRRHAHRPEPGGDRRSAGRHRRRCCSRRGRRRSLLDRPPRRRFRSGRCP